MLTYAPKATGVVGSQPFVARALFWRLLRRQPGGAPSLPLRVSPNPRPVSGFGKADAVGPAEARSCGNSVSEGLPSGPCLVKALGQAPSALLE